MVSVEVCAYCTTPTGPAIHALTRWTLTYRLLTDGASLDSAHHITGLPILTIARLRRQIQADPNKAERQYQHARNHINQWTLTP